MKTDEELLKMYSARWRAYFKPGFGEPAIVNGKDEHEARLNALACYRKKCTHVSFTPLEKIVHHVEPIG